MKVLLYCAQSYSIAILAPLGEEARRRGYEVLWYCPSYFADKLPEGVRRASTHREAFDFKSDVIFVPGNDVPFYFRGLKVQVFHGFAGEKKGHFRIRGYFDLYLTQGPYFTERFLALSEKYRNFEVAETGWPKLDPYFKSFGFLTEKAARRPVLLYAPTFSRRLTSATNLIQVIDQLSVRFDVTVKFHPLTHKSVVSAYARQYKHCGGIKFSGADDICSLIVESDVVLSDTSSVVYEALILGRRVVTFRSKSKQLFWENVSLENEVLSACERALDGSGCENNDFRTLYHPYNDGEASKRMMNAVESFICRRGVPCSRRVSFLRRVRYLKDFNLWGRKEGA